MPTYNVGDFFLYKSPLRRARYLGVVIQKNPPLISSEPRLLILAGLKDDLRFGLYSAGLASIEIQDRLISYINNVRDTNSEEDFQPNFFETSYFPSIKAKPACARLDIKRLTSIKTIQALEEALKQLEPVMQGENTKRLIRFFQHVQPPFHSTVSPSLSL